MRWLFLVLVLGNFFPALLATNSGELIPARMESARDTLRQASPVAPVVLLSELGGDMVVDSGAQNLPERRELACFVVGPLASIDVANNLGSQMKIQGLPVESMWREVENGADYWVYLSPLPSNRAAARLLQELSANNIDSFLVSEGELEGAIALNVFSDEREAKALQRRMESLGYEAKIHQMGRWAREYWLLSERIPSGEEWQAVAAVVEDNEIPQKMSRRSCKTVASAMRFQ
jgi:hypothetical protein